MPEVVPGGMPKIAVPVACVLAGLEAVSAAFPWLKLRPPRKIPKIAPQVCCKGGGPEVVAKVPNPPLGCTDGGPVLTDPV